LIFPPKTSGARLPADRLPEPARTRAPLTRYFYFLGFIICSAKIVSYLLVFVNEIILKFLKSHKRADISCPYDNHSKLYIHSNDDGVNILFDNPKILC